MLYLDWEFLEFLLFSLLLAFVTAACEFGRCSVKPERANDEGDNIASLRDTRQL